MTKAALGWIAVEPLKPLYPALDFETPVDRPHEGHSTDKGHNPGHNRQPLVVFPRSQSRLALRTVSTRRTSKAITVALPWLHSTRNLDFCLLALCSCLLAVLCHQVVVIPKPGTAASSIVSSAATPRSAQLDFLFKAGLYTGKEQPEIGDEEDPA